MYDKFIHTCRGFMTNLMMQIRKKAPIEEIDYLFLMDCLKDYKSPRAKLTTLLKKKDLIRVKKGIYLFSPDYRKELYSPEILANKIYGPSYVSLEYALSYYGLIPEYVSEVTSVSIKRNRNFDTPIGRFSYKHLPIALYKIGFNLIFIREWSTALIATPEKALADLFYLNKYDPQNQEEFSALLFDFLRLDEEKVAKMKSNIFRDILKAGGSPALKLMIEWLRRHRQR